MQEDADPAVAENSEGSTVSSKSKSSRKSSTDFLNEFDDNFMTEPSESNECKEHEEGADPGVGNLMTTAGPV